MQVVEKGHEYLLQGGQQLLFINKKPKEEGGKELELVHDGTTNEELIDVLLDRLSYLDELMPCMENKQAIKSLTTAQDWLKRRTAEREARGVEGKNVK